MSAKKSMAHVNRFGTITPESVDARLRELSELIQSMRKLRRDMPDGELPIDGATKLERGIELVRDYTKQLATAIVKHQYEN